MKDATMLSTVPPAVTAERANTQATPKPLAAIVGTLLVNGRPIPMMADHALEAVSVNVAALARPILEEFGISE